MDIAVEHLAPLSRIPRRAFRYKDYPGKLDVLIHLGQDLVLDVVFNVIHLNNELTN